MSTPPAPCTAPASCGWPPPATSWSHYGMTGSGTTLPTSPSSCLPGSSPSSAASRTCSPPTWPSCRTCTAGSTPKATPAPQSPARLAITNSPSTCRGAAWGNSHVRGRPPARGGRVPRLPPALAAGHPARPGARRQADLHRPCRAHQHPDPTRKVTPVPRWWRNKGRASATGPAPQAPALPRDDWRTLPPLPSVMQRSVVTVATDRFSDSLSTWHNPSFLAPLGHRVDRDGPAGLITGIATVQPSPQPQAYHPDHPLPSADGADAQVQRSVAAWPVRSAARSWLVSAPEVDHDPVPLAAVPAGVAAAGEERASTENASARDQEPEPPIAPADPPAALADPPAAEADPPAGSTAPPLNPAAGAGEAAGGADEAAGGAGEAAGGADEAAGGADEAAGGADEAAGGAGEAKATAPTLQRGQLETSITPANPHPADRGP